MRLVSCHSLRFAIATCVCVSLSGVFFAERTKRVIILASWQATTPTHGAIRPAPGTHEELLAGNGFYADIYNSQFTLID